VRGTLYVVNASPSNTITASYFGEISRLIKTGNRIDALQFYVYPDGTGPADRTTLGQTIIIPVVPPTGPDSREFIINESYNSSSDPVATYLNTLLQASQPIVVRGTTKDAIEAGGVANATTGTNPSGHVFTDEDVTNPAVNYSVIDDGGTLTMVTSFGQNMAVTNITNFSGITLTAGNF
jgi:hypothetical protein